MVSLADDPVRYIEEPAYRRGVLERDLTVAGNEYAQERLALYALDDVGWDLLPTGDELSLPLTLSDVAALSAGEVLSFDAQRATRLEPLNMPMTDAQWLELGRRVFFEYPLRSDPIYTALVTVPGALEQSGFLQADDVWVGLRLVGDGEGGLAVAPTCAQCHASFSPDGQLSGVLSNRSMDVGAARLLVMGIESGPLPSELDSTDVADLERLGPGRTDVLPDQVFNPYALPDFGGLVDLPYLHHNANWYHHGTATLAVRCETLFITADNARSRIPRVLAWALARWLRSLPAPVPLEAEPAANATEGEQVFHDAGCAGCHVPPLYTSDREVTLDEIGTDPGAGESDVRWTGHYRIPSLRGVGRLAPYLHHGAVPTLEELFDPGRSEAGHPFGLSLDDEERAALLSFLRSL